jgi:hypothetical protein
MLQYRHHGTRAQGGLKRENRRKEKQKQCSFMQRSHRVQHSLHCTSMKSFVQLCCHKSHFFSPSMFIKTFILYGFLLFLLARNPDRSSFIKAHQMLDYIGNNLETLLISSPVKQSSSQCQRERSTSEKTWQEPACPRNYSKHLMLYVWAVQTAEFNDKIISKNDI